MGLLTPCVVPMGAFLYTMVFPGEEYLLPSSRVPGVCPGGGGGGVGELDEIDTCISHRHGKSDMARPRPGPTSVD